MSDPPPKPPPLPPRPKKPVATTGALSTETPAEENPQDQLTAKVIATIEEDITQISIAPAETEFKTPLPSTDVQLIHSTAEESQIAKVEEACSRLTDNSAGLDQPTPAHDKDPAQEGNVIRQGTLVKINRDGNGDQYEFTLSNKSLSYTELSNSTAAKLSTSKIRSLDLNTVIASQAPVDFEGTEATRSITFRILSKQKSFYLRASLPEEAIEWTEAISAAARAFQLAELGRVVDETETAPILISKADTPACQLCSKAFGFFSRRHHCRNCGKCVCDKCSRDKVRIPRIDDRALFKVCHHCARELVSNRKYGAGRGREDNDEES